MALFAHGLVFAWHDLQIFTVRIVGETAVLLLFAAHAAGNKKAALKAASQG
ncbi:hypothetical protein [Cupriavidus laharis]|uniref:hypothetical protein n=1 Tax=Cupriavidus laharis TaxID=151654 RepID=UPI001CC5F337|nr:hypothetical protein [Cupriavidus laharis]